MYPCPWVQTSGRLYCCLMAVVKVAFKIPPEKMIIGLCLDFKTTIEHNRLIDKK